MKYEISYTNRFKQSLKKCVKRGLDIECLKNVINIFKKQVLFHQNINPTNSKEIIQDAGNVIYNLTGF